MEKALRAAVARRLPIVLFAVTLLAAVGGSLAGDDHGGDHDRARQALEAGEVLPLRVILERVERDHPGQVVEVELERDDGRWEYEIKLLRSGGSLVKLKVDARDGTVVGVKGRSNDRHGKLRRDGGDERNGERR